MVVWSEFGVGLYMYFSSDIRLYILDLGVSFFFSHFSCSGSWTYRYLEHLAIYWNIELFLHALDYYARSTLILYEVEGNLVLRNNFL